MYYKNVDDSIQFSDWALLFNSPIGRFSQFFNSYVLSKMSFDDSQFDDPIQFDDSNQFLRLKSTRRFNAAAADAEPPSAKDPSGAMASERQLN